MTIEIPELCLILLIGASSSGKSSLAKKHFAPSEIVSSDACRLSVSDDENNLDATQDAFELLHFIVEKRLKRGHLTVVDATNLKAQDRKSLIALSKKYYCRCIAIVLEVPITELLKRHAKRKDRFFEEYVLYRQVELLQKHRDLRSEGIRYSYILHPPEIDELQFKRIKKSINQTDVHDGLDIIGDVHGCYDELSQLLEQLGYTITEHEGQMQVTRPEGRRLVFVGDLTDRGEQNVAVLRLVMHLFAHKIAFCACGNHDDKLQRYLAGNKVNIKHGLEKTVTELTAESPEFRASVLSFLTELPSHYVFDDGKLVVAHAGILQEMQGRNSGVIKAFCLYGQTNGEIDEFGLPVRYPWAEDYRGKAQVVYGHTPVPEVLALNNTFNIDTGCVFGGKLTAFRYPNQEWISVPAKKVYSQSARPFPPTQSQNYPSSQTESPSNPNVTNLTDPP